MKAEELNTERSVTKTGFPQIDDLFDGGIPHGRIIEVAGSWSVGKSTLAYQIIASAQRQGRPCLLLDAERAYTKEYGAALGVDNAELDIFRAWTAEDYLDAVFTWIGGGEGSYIVPSTTDGKNSKKIDYSFKSHKGGIVIIDAIGALLPREESEKSSESRSIGLQARIIGSFCRKIVPVLDETDTALIVLNHTFIPLGLNSVSSSGGKKLEYARSAWLILGGAYGKPVKRSADGLKTLIPMQLEVRKNKLKANMGTKISLELVQGAGFVGETVTLPEKKKAGRPKKV